MRRRLPLLLLGVLALGAYFVWGMFSVYGGYYIGYPPYTPAWMNGTTRPIVRDFDLDRGRILRVWGEAGQGRVIIRVDGREHRTVIGRFDTRLPLRAGRHQLRIEPQEASGSVNYSLR
ncbi:MAG TPA: hypothetical protein VNT60_04195 [Deinococcales bacterium]|nr:hypothetical protein [Deinococcales bacterium]